MFYGDSAVLLEVARERLGQAILFLVIEAQLHRAVAIFFHRLALDHPVWAGQNHGDRNQVPLGVVNAGLSKFFSEQTDHNVKS